MDHRKCNKCRQELPADKEHFYANKYDKLGLERRCKSCDNAKSDERKRRRFAKLKGGPCTDCERTFPPCAMSFDHLPGQVKTKELWQLRSASLERIRTELESCELVCLNCHAIRTHKRGSVSGA